MCLLLIAPLLQTVIHQARASTRPSGLPSCRCPKSRLETTKTVRRGDLYQRPKAAITADGRRQWTHVTASIRVCLSVPINDHFVLETQQHTEAKCTFVSACLPEAGDGWWLQRLEQERRSSPGDIKKDSVLLLGGGGKQDSAEQPVQSV